MGYIDKLKEIVKKYLEAKNITSTKTCVADQEKFAEQLLIRENNSIIIKDLPNFLISKFENKVSFVTLAEEFNKIPNINKINMEDYDKSARIETLNAFKENMSLDDQEIIFERDGKEKETYEEFKKKYPNFEWDKQYNTRMERQCKSAFSIQLRNRLSDCLPVLDKFVDEETGKEIDNIIDNHIPIEDRTISYKHEYDEKIKALIEEDPKLTDDLNYINDNVIIKANSSDTAIYESITNSLSGNLERKINYDGREEINKDDYLNGLIEEDKGRFFVSKDQNYNQKEVMEKYNNLKYQISDKTKSVLKKVLHKLADMKAPDGSPMIDVNKIKSEESTKVYGFKNITSIRSQSIVLIDNYENGDIDKETFEKGIKRLRECHEQSIKDYKEIFEDIKELGMGNVFPGNVNVSRNQDMPEFIIKDFQNASVMNSMYQMLKTVADSGLTIDEFVEDINKGIQLQNEKLSNFKSYNRYVDKFSELDLIEIMASRWDTTEYENYYKRKTAISVETINQRQTAIFSMIESDPEMAKQNKMKSTLKLQYVVEKERKPYDIIRDKYYGKENKYLKETIKNIFICQDEHKNYMSLSPATNNFIDPYTGHEIGAFDYNEYMMEHAFDYEALADKLNNYSKAITEKNNSNPTADDPIVSYSFTGETMQASIKEVANDLIMNRDLINTPEFENFLNLAGKTFDDYKKDKNIKKSSKNQVQAYLKESNNVIDKTNACKITNEFKQLNNHYNSRSKIGKLFNPGAWFEKKAINKIKDTFEANNISRDNINQVLNGTVSVRDFIKDNNLFETQAVNGIENNPQRKSIIVDLNNEKNVSLSKGHEKTQTIQKDLNINNNKK